MDESQLVTAHQSKSLGSPDGALTLTVGIDEHVNQLWYEVKKEDHAYINKSLLALYGPDEKNFTHTPDALPVEYTSFDETWDQPWGEQRSIHNNYNELAVKGESFTIRFRLFNEGFGFRYELHGESETAITHEETSFNINGNASAWWIPALGQNHYEHLYHKTPIQELGIAHTPLTLELENGGFMAIHEAALYNYGSMNLIPAEQGLKSKITPLSTGNAAEISLPFTTPWRTVIFSDTAVGLTTSRIMLNLNEPSKIEDTSWIQPAKFMGIWWGMFLHYFTWGSGEKHGATTANAFRYINACKEFGIRGLLIEGWNEGWDGDWTQNGDKMNLMQPYPDFDIHAITKYAKSQGVDLIGHHETAGNMAHYEWQLPEAYDYYNTFGVRYIKTGYVSPRSNGKEFHSSQFGVNHYQKTVEMAAERRIMLDIHEPVKGTGIERTWPNLMTREGVMGQEYEGSGAVTPEHTTVLPFTRLLAGPLDYTPGLFNLSGTSRKISSTLAKQLAFYVTLFSPLQMVADLPEHYRGHAALQFIKDVPVNWDTTIPLDGVIGDFFVVARKDRESDDWYIGAITDENERTVTIPLSFLPEYRSYTATIYRDADDADWQSNPEAYVIDTQNVSKETTLTLRLAPGGGCAIRLAIDGETPLPYAA
ncbi:glycoside hydrolase family 97 protein [Candidatus Saccharibacteria bacterium TM7i]|nr:glycoside hydrolase family 97 protein [Candidatus Saccharibacteria bacterium TM7i]